MFQQLSFLILIYSVVAIVRTKKNQTQNQQLIEVNPIQYANATFFPVVNYEKNNSIKGANQNFSVYQLSPLSITTLQFDFRHLSNYTNQTGIEFQYEKQWEIAIIINKNIRDTPEILFNRRYFVSLPKSFLNPDTNKMSGYQFSLLAMTQLEVNVEVAILQNDFYSNTYQFMNVTRMMYQTPKRAIIGEDKSFAFIVSNSDSATLPYNALLWDNEQKYPEYIVSYSPGSDGYKPKKQPPNFKDANKFWGKQSEFLVNYLPFFSNCEGYGQYLYISQLTENSECDLIPVEKTKPINPFLFGDTPIADQCNLKILCTVDDDMKTQDIRWFQLQIADSIFTVAQDPLSAEDMIARNYNPDTAVSVVLLNSVPQGKMPSDIYLHLGYYQVTKKSKLMIEGTLSFGNFYDITQDQIDGKAPVFYNLNFNYVSLSQAGLINTFALSWEVYLILYLGILVMSTCENLFFLSYHWLMNRKRPRPPLRFFPYIFTIYPDSVIGTVLGILPITVLYILISIIMNGQLFTIKLEYASEWYPATLEDPANGITLFDGFKNGQLYSDSSFAQLQASRCGLSCIVIGIYLIFILNNVFLEDYGNEKVKKEEEAYNGNVWHWKMWRKSQVLFSMILVTFWMNFLVQFSYSTFFGNNAYFLMIGFKVASMVIEYSLEEYFEDGFIVCPIASVMASCVGIATMGNPTFYAFLFSFFIDVGTQMVERPYIMMIEEEVTNFLEDLFSKLVRVIKKFLDEDEEEDQEEVDNHLQEQKTDEIDISDSDILFSEEYQENLVSDDESISSAKHIGTKQQISALDNSFSELEKDDYEDQFRKVYEDKLRNMGQNKTENNHETEFSQQESENENEEKEEIIPYFANFAIDMVALYQQPFNIAIMWILYDQSQWASSYGITKVTFIFYLIWSLILIPFQIISDIIYFNLIYQYHGIDFLHYLIDAKERFKSRKQSWIGLEETEKTGLERSLVNLDKWAFSSQYFFIQTLAFSASFAILIGTQTIYANQYDIFGDQALIFIVVFWLIICYLVHRSFLFLGKKLGLWRIKKSAKIHHDDEDEDDEKEKESEEQKTKSSGDEQLTTEGSKPKAKDPRLRVPKCNWETVIHLQENEVRLKEISHNLTDDQLITEQFRRLFLTSNKTWLKENVKQILSPRTLKIRRKQVIKQFSNIYGPLNTIETDGTFLFEEKKPTEISNIHKLNNIEPTPATKKILRYWLHRHRTLKIATQQIGGLMERVTKQHCDYCGLNWGLRCETSRRIEDLHLEFLKAKSLQKIQTGPQIDDWQNFFKKNTQLQTICLICSGFIIEHKYKQMQEKLPKCRFSLHQVAKAIFYWIVFYRNMPQRRILNESIIDKP